MKKNPVVKIENLTLSYVTDKRVVNVYENFSLVISENEKIALIGQSGNGKSTLAKFLTGILPKSAVIKGGTYSLEGVDIFKKEKFLELNKVRGSKIAFIFQDATESLNPIQTIGRHFEELLGFHQICEKEEVRSLAIEKLESLLIKDAEKVYDSYPHQLSGGMCQRVCIAMCLCLDPILLIGDEPTSSLDVLSAYEVIENLRNLEGISVLLITHDISVAAKVADRILVLDKGEICEDAPTQILLAAPKHEYTKSLIDSYNEIPNVNEMGGETIEPSPILRISGVSKSYGSFRVLSDINLEVYRNEILGIIGESGCGKSTLSRCIMGVEENVAGEIFYEDVDLLKLKVRKRRKFSPEIQMIFQNSRAVLNPRRKVLDIVQEPLFYNGLYKGHREEMAMALLGDVGIDESMYYVRPTELSTGQCQRVAIARALVSKPKILICDEAVSSLDINIQLQILKLLLELKVRYNLTIIMVSHDIRVLQNYCNRIAIMKDSRILEIVDNNSLSKGLVHPYTENLLNVSCSKSLETVLQ